MNSFNDTLWMPFKLSHIFDYFEKGKCSDSNSLSDGDEIEYIGAKKTENGVMKRVKIDKDLVSKGNAICFICQGEGSNGYNNYYDCDTIQTTSNMMGYSSHLNKYNALFLVTVLDLEKIKWAFGRGRAPKLKNTIIRLPAVKDNNDFIPDWKFMEEYIRQLLTKEISLNELSKVFKENNRSSLNVSRWHPYKIKEIFSFPKIKKYSSNPEIEGNIPFVTSCSTNQGVDSLISSQSIIENVISISTNGRCFDCFYHDEFIAISTDVELITSKKMNKYSALFICSVLQLEQEKWGYGRKPKNKAIDETEILLPYLNDDEPDWSFMEKYIKSLPFSKHI